MTHHASQSEWSQFAQPKSAASIKLSQLRIVEECFNLWLKKQERCVKAPSKASPAQGDMLQQRTDIVRYTASVKSEEVLKRAGFIRALQLLTGATPAGCKDVYIAPEKIFRTDKNNADFLALKDLEQRATNQLSLLRGDESAMHLFISDQMLTSASIELCKTALANTKAINPQTPQDDAARLTVNSSSTGTGAWWK